MSWICIVGFIVRMSLFEFQFWIFNVRLVMWSGGLMNQVSLDWNWLMHFLINFVCL